MPRRQRTSKRKHSNNIQKLDDFTDIDSDSSSESSSREPSLEHAKDIALVSAILPKEEREKRQKDKSFMFMIYISGVYFVLNLPWVDTLIQSAFPMTESWLILGGVKTIVFFMIIFVIRMLMKNK